MIADTALGASSVTGAPRLELAGVCKAFGGVPAVIDMSLAVSPGEIHALVGENGAGKSTVMNMVSGVLIPDSGEIRLDGSTVALTSPRRAQDFGVGTVFQEAPNVLERVEGYKALFKEKYPEITVVDVVNDKADPSYAPTAYAQALQAHPDVVGIGGTDGDSGKGAAIAVRDAGRTGKVKFVAMDRNDDMLPFIEDGTIHGSVVQKSYAEAFIATHFLYWLNANEMKVLADWKAAGVDPLPEKIETGTMRLTQQNVKLFKHN